PASASSTHRYARCSTAEHPQRDRNTPKGALMRRTVSRASAAVVLAFVSFRSSSFAAPPPFAGPSPKIGPLAAQRAGLATGSSRVIITAVDADRLPATA